jgi:hypothetical protein
MAKAKKNTKTEEEILHDDSQNPSDDDVAPSDDDLIQDEDDDSDYSIGQIVVDDENADDAALGELDPSLNVDENWDFDEEGDDFLGEADFEDDGDYGEDL